MDHEEIAVMYEWKGDRWNSNSNNNNNGPKGEGEGGEMMMPRGGVMGWPLVMFGSFLPQLRNIYSHKPQLSQIYEAHIGIEQQYEQQLH